MDNGVLYLALSVPFFSVHFILLTLHVSLSALTHMEIPKHITNKQTSKYRNKVQKGSGAFLMHH
jgi:hypothetical protein